MAGMPASKTQTLQMLMTTRRVPLTLFARQGITKTGKVVQHVKQVIISQKKANSVVLHAL
jgi:hypothetical protein